MFTLNLRKQEPIFFLHLRNQTANVNIAVNAAISMEYRMNVMKNSAIALTAVALMAGPMVSAVQAEEKYYLLTDCTTVEDPAACRTAKVVPGMVVGGFLGLVTGGAAFWAAGGALAAGSTAAVLGTTIGVETALVGGAVAGGLAGGVLAGAQ